MILKTLVTGMAAAAVVAAAAGGVTSIASNASSGAPSAITPVVLGIPFPQAPAPELQAPLTDTVNALGAGGSFAGKSVYIENPRPARVRRRVVEVQQRRQQGLLPADRHVADVDENGPIATANVTATAPTAPPPRCR